VPPTKSGLLVETFARQVATHLQKEYLPVVGKVRPTREQKYCTNREQKAENVQAAFCVLSPESVEERILLLIDDIYDSGYMVRHEPPHKCRGLVAVLHLNSRLLRVALQLHRTLHPSLMRDSGQHDKLPVLSHHGLPTCEKEAFFVDQECFT